MRTLILGAGATGGYFGARMIEGGADVTFLVRPKRAEQLHAHGLKVKSMFGDLALTDLRLIEKVDQPADQPYDLVILSSKAYDLDSAIEAIQPSVGKDSAVLPLLNGMRHIEILQKKFGAERVLGGLCIISSKLEDDGSIAHYNDAQTIKFGELSGAVTPRIEQIKAMLQPTKISWQASQAIQQDMWEKWTMLASLAGMTCLMRASVGQISRSPGGVAFAEQLLDECLSISAAENFPGRPEFIKSVRARSTDPSSTLSASMLRDIERGGKTEADHILGDLIAHADSKSLPVPLLKLAYCHVKAYELKKAEEG